MDDLRAAERPVGWRQMRIVAAACFKPVSSRPFDGMIFTIPPPARHHDILRMMADLGVQQDHTVEQGFLTDCGKFMRRAAALMIAKNAGQLNRKEGGYQGLELFSEDLW